MKQLLFALLFAPSIAWGHFYKLPPMVTPPPPVVVSPPTVVAPSQPSAQASTASGTGVVGWYVMGFLIVFYYLAICQLEEERDPAMHKLLMCPQTPDWKQCDPFSQAPC